MANVGIARVAPALRGGGLGAACAVPDGLGLGLGDGLVVGIVTAPEAGFAALGGFTEFDGVSFDPLGVMAGPAGVVGDGVGVAGVDVVGAGGE